MAIARSVPLYTARSGSTPLNANQPAPPANTSLTVEIFIVNDGNNQNVLLKNKLILLLCYKSGTKIYEIFYLVFGIGV